MLNFLKDYIKRYPRLFDTIQGLRRPNDEIGRWLDQFSRAHERVRCIQIGAADGLRGDPLRYFILRDNWRVLLVEPLPRVFGLLKANYAYRASQDLAFANCLVGRQDGQETIWTMLDVSFLDMLPIEDQLGLQREASMDRNLTKAAIDKYLIQRYGNPEPNAAAVMKSETVQTLSFDSLIAQHWKHEQIDLVMIDAEGHDDQIVMSIDVERHQPKAIIFEAFNLSEERKLAVYAWLTARGYEVDPGKPGRGDAIAVRRSSIGGQ